jgi:sugar (pentulose or hexulose) kinase
MPGFAAPKLLWIAAHEPEIFAATKLVLVPKAYLRLVLTGEAIDAVCARPQRIETFEPESALSDAYAERLPAWRELYRPRQ